MRCARIACFLFLAIALTTATGRAVTGPSGIPRIALAVAAETPDEVSKDASGAYQLALDPRIFAFQTLSEVWEVSFLSASHLSLLSYRNFAVAVPPGR